MGWILPRARRIWFDVLLVELAGLALGVIIGVITSSYQEAVNAPVDVVAYQNFGIITGTIIGLATCLIGILGYIATTRYFLHHQWFHPGTLLFSGAVVGGVTGLVTYLIVGGAGVSYGMVEREIRAVIADSVISAIMGGGFGVFAAWLISKVRGYE
jgi:hypothetical protein